MNRNSGECVGISPYSRIYCFSLLFLKTKYVYMYIYNCLTELQLSK
jgi:hypothetical protein